VDGFFWSKGSEILLSMGLAWIVMAPAFFPLGLIVSCLHHLSCPAGRWDTRAGGWLLIGAGAGAGFGSALAGTSGSTMLLLCASAIPVLAAALVVTLSTSARQWPGAAATTADRRAEIPTFSDRLPRLLRASLVAASGGMACVTVLFAKCAARMGESPTPLIAAMIAALGLGVLAACRRAGADTRSVGGFGAACALCGAVWCATFAWLQYIGRAEQTALVAGALTGSSCAGYMLAYGRQVLLCRTGDRSKEGTETLTRSLVCVGLTIWPIAPAAIVLLGASTALLTSALSFLALGGSLIIHDPAVPASRQARLSAIFGCVGAMALLACTSP
jgi:hypothetical protein